MKICFKVKASSSLDFDFFMLYSLCMHKIYTHILFDLDGTLTDPAVGITNSIMYALKHFGIEESDRTKLYPFIGPPLLESFEHYYNFTPEQAQEALNKYREYFSTKGLFENKVYPGIPQLLHKLKTAGKKIYLATSKPEVFARQILDHFDLAQYFDFAGGSDLEGVRVHKADVINYVLDAAKLDNAETLSQSIVMIGDRKHDIIGSQQHGLDSIGVLYGYGSREELQAAGATHIVTTVAELSEFLICS